MQHSLLKFSAALLLGLSLTTVHAQTMYVKEKDNIETAYPLSNIRKLTFSSGNLIITRDNKSTSSYNFNGLRYLSFQSNVTWIATPILKYPVLNTYPNPAGEVLNVDLSGDEIKGATLEILRIDGSVAIAEKIENAAWVSIDLSQLPHGIYLCRYTNGNEIKTTKIIKH